MIIPNEHIIKSLPLDKELLTQEGYDILLQGFNKQAELIAELQSELFYHKQELFKLKKVIFGSKSERFIPNQINVNQLTLGLDVPEIESPAPVSETVTYTRTKAPVQDKIRQQPVRQALPAHLPRKEEVIEPQEDIHGAKKIGENITEILEYESGRLFVRKIIRPKYLKVATVAPETSSEVSSETTIITAEMPSLPIPKGNAGPGLLSHIIISKFVDHLPFYRQVQIIKREGVTIAESTINGWFTSSCNLITPLYNTQKVQLLKATYLMADESPIPVLTSDKPGATAKGYFWVYYSPEKKIVLFDYQPGRDRAGPLAMLKDFNGSLQTDGYNVYDIFDKPGIIVLLACMAHVRRKFIEAQDNDAPRAQYALELIQELYKVEDQAREQALCANARKELRQQISKPILDSFGQWIKDNVTQVLPKSSIGKAIAYTLGLWDRLIRYIDDGRYEIDNNLIENSIRPVAIGRKNYLFAGSHEGAQRAAMMYSLLGTCKMHNVEPFAYLKDVLARIPEHKANRLEELLPCNWNHLQSI
jgi:transposase